MPNQTPEQQARNQIDRQLVAAGWVVQGKKEVDLYAHKGVAVKEYTTSVGPADYVLFVDQRAVGVIEAKREELGQNLTTVEEQSGEYATAELKYVDSSALHFVYESTGVLTRFTDLRDPRPRAREVFSFHRPEMLQARARRREALRSRLQNLPPLRTEGLRPAQISAIRNLERSFADNRPRALIQMATGAGKTFTACTFVYRLLKHAKARRILFLVDTRNLGEQAEQAFNSFQPTDDNRKFTDLYNVQLLRSSYVAADSQVCISTIQRLYSILKGEELPEGADEDNPNESKAWEKSGPLPVVYNPDNPVGQFDFIVIDECHRSIYNLWRQVLDYYDAFLVGLTATPDSRTYGFFNGNVVSEYTYEESVIDGVNVPFDVYRIETEITQNGSVIVKGSETYVEKREKLSRRRRWEALDEDLDYDARKLDRDVVSPDQIRTILREFRRVLPRLFPDRFEEDGTFEVPKTLIFAKTDSHADDIIRLVREEFGEGNDFCKKVTYKADEDAKTVLGRFRNNWAPRIAVTVDMIATGTDVKPLEVLLFMRDVKSANYFEQMKGRGTRTIDLDALRSVTRTARHAKTHFVIVDAVGATESKKTLSRPLERKPGTAFKDLLQAVKMGVRDEELFSSLANRLLRLDRQLKPEQQAHIQELTGGRSVRGMVKKLLDAYDPDVAETTRERIEAERAGDPPTAVEAAVTEALQALQKDAAQVFNGPLVDYLENARRVHEQTIDHESRDRVLRSEAAGFSTARSREVVSQFEAWLAGHRDEFTALRIYFNEPQRRREVTYRMIKTLLARLLNDQPTLAPHYVWQAYAGLETVRGRAPESQLTALVSLLRRASGLDAELQPYPGQVDRNFKNWIFGQNAARTEPFSEDQLAWLRMIRDYVKESFHLEREDLELDPFNRHGGIGGLYRAFGAGMEPLIDELNEVLVA